ncbi:hypothetical protein VTL71DRAFT_9978 [Oculimacula yallundae]|uniref:Uncharacterized protein n=1 Tax=Oculimacula yallundae TaxID=86028 RepID=A0ABR4BQ25_9HELO
MSLISFIYIPKLTSNLGSRLPKEQLY